MENKFSERLKNLISDESVHGFAKRSGISDSVMRKYLSGEATPGIDKALSMAESLGVSVGWLITGRGPKDPSVVYAGEEREPIKNRQMLALGAYGHQDREIDLDTSPYERGITRSSTPPLGNGASKSIPMVNVAASAGHGALIYDEDHTEIVSFSQEWLHQQRLSPNELFIVPTIGESMEPTIHSGDLLLCSQAEHHKKAGDGVYVVRLDGNILVKRTQVLPGKKIKVSSDNANQFSPYEIELNDGIDFAVIGKVVFVLCKRV